jgi:hypothetical protein
VTTPPSSSRTIITEICTEVSDAASSTRGTRRTRSELPPADVLAKYGDDLAAYPDEQ